MFGSDFSAHSKHTVIVKTRSSNSSEGAICEINNVDTSKTIGLNDYDDKPQTWRIYNKGSS